MTIRSIPHWLLISVVVEVIDGVAVEIEKDARFTPAPLICRTRSQAIFAIANLVERAVRISLGPSNPYINMRGSVDAAGAQILDDEELLQERAEEYLAFAKTIIVRSSTS